MVDQPKGLLYKHQDPGSIPRTCIKDKTKQQQQHLGVIPGICILSTERWEVETGGLWGLNGQQEQPTTGQYRGGGRIPTAFTSRCLYMPTPSHKDMHNPPPQVWTDPES